MRQKWTNWQKWTNSHKWANWQKWTVRFCKHFLTKPCRHTVLFGLFRCVIEIFEINNSQPSIIVCSVYEITIAVCVVTGTFNGSISINMYWYVQSSMLCWIHPYIINSVHGRDFKVCSNQTKIIQSNLNTTFKSFGISIATK